MVLKLINYSSINFEERRKEIVKVVHKKLKMLKLQCIVDDVNDALKKKKLKQLLKMMLKTPVLVKSIKIKQIGELKAVKRRRIRSIMLDSNSLIECHGSLQSRLQAAHIPQGNDWGIPFNRFFEITGEKGFL